MPVLGSILIAGEIWDWMHRLGGPGLILLGLIDNSVIPIPGGMDVFVILLASHHHAWWPYYGFMAAVGAVIGGYVTYRLAEKGGEQTLEKKIGKSRAEKVYRRFAKRGFSTILAGAILPPPFPLVPVIMAAGVMKYPRNKFFAALGTGRSIRFFGVAFLGRIYGTAIIGWLSLYYKPVLYALIGLACLGGLAALLYFKWYRPKRQRDEREHGQEVEQFPIPWHKKEGTRNGG